MDIKRYYEKNPQLRPRDHDGGNDEIQYPPGYIESLLENDAIIPNGQ